MRNAIAALLAATTLLALAPDAASALSAERNSSSAQVQAPVLAPGVWGSAPLSGELRRDGAFTLEAPVSSIQTGNAFYNTFLRQGLGNKITFVTSRPRVVFQRGGIRRLQTVGTVYVAGHSASTPIFVREITNARGTTMSSYFTVALSAYGIRTATGGEPGPLRVAIRAYFPGK